MSIKYIINLSEDEKIHLEKLIRSPSASAFRNLRARILLASDQSLGRTWLSDDQVARSVGTSKATVFRTRRNLVENGLEQALSYRKPRARPETRRLDGASEAHLIALVCSPAPNGLERWSLRLLASKLVELGYVENTVSKDTVSRVLKKTNLNHGGRKSG